METLVKLDASKLKTYLELVAQQRKRQLVKFTNDYGPDSAVVREAQTEIKNIELALSELLFQETKKSSVKK